MNDALDLTIRDWLIPAAYTDKDLRPTIAWEFARESLTITNLAFNLKAVLSSLAAEGLQSDHAERLLELARQRGYSYEEFLCHSASGKVHALNREYVASAKELDRIMPDTDWRFVLSDEFPASSIWNISQSSIRPAKRRPVGRKTAPSQLQQLVDGINNGRNAVPGVYANEFEWTWDELTATEVALPDDENYYATEVAVVIILVPLDRVRDRSFEELALVISELIHDCGKQHDQTQGVYNGIPLIALQELVVPGSTSISLSQGPREKLCRWVSDGAYAGTRFRGVVIPQDEIDAGRVSPQSIIRDALRPGRSGSATVVKCGGLWGWDFARRETALRRLGAIRATSAGLKYSEIGVSLSRLKVELGNESKQLPEAVQDGWCKARLRIRPDYNKADALYEAANGALRDFHEVFPALEGEEPRAFLYRSGRRQ